MENTPSSRSGRTFPEPSQAMPAMTSESSSKSSQKSLTRPYLCLDLRRESGRDPDSWLLTADPLPGASWTPNTTESPNVAVASFLSWILEVNAPAKYHLSAKACQGILRRASKRGKQLPAMLKEALEQMISESTETEETEEELDEILEDL